jgi:Zn-dependent peptidase ImmA (M78 family)
VRMTSSRYSPWRELRALDQLIFDQVDLPSGDAWWVPAHDVILMRPRLLQVERRCSLAHELGHRHLEHTGQCRYGDSRRQGARAELEADQWAARKLITIEALGSVLVWTDDRDEAADELWVTRRLLDVRLAHIHPAERAYVRRRFNGEE